MTRNVMTITIVVCIGLFLWQAYVHHSIDKGKKVDQKQLWWINYFITVISVIIPLAFSLYDPMSLPNLKFEYDYKYFDKGIEREDLYQVIPELITVDNVSYYYPGKRWIGFVQEHRFVNGHYNTIYDTSLTASSYIVIYDGNELLASIPIDANDDFYITKNYDNSTGKLEFVHSPKRLGTMMALLKKSFENDGCPYDIGNTIIIKFHFKQSVDDESYVISKLIGEPSLNPITEDELRRKEIKGVSFTKEDYDAYLDNLEIEGNCVTSFYDPIDKYIDVIYDAIGFAK